MSDRQLPHDVDAERSVLGAVVLRHDVLDLVDLQADEFFVPAHREIWEAMHALAKRARKWDTVDLADELKKRGELQRLPGGEPYLLGLSDAPSAVASNDPSQVVRIVRRTAQQRRLIRAAADLQSRAYAAGADPADLLEDHRRELADSESHQVDGGTVRLGAKLNDVLATIESKGQDPAAHKVMTGLVEFDGKIGGFLPGRLVVVAARPGQGKTAFAVTVARNASKRGVPVLVFSLEMEFQEIAERIISAEARIDGHHLSQGAITKEQHRTLMGPVLSRIHAAPLYVNDRVRKVSRILVEARRWRARHPGRLALVVVDYLGLVQFSGKADRREQEVAQMSGAMKGLAKDLSCPVMLVSQLNREAAPGEVPELRHLRESGAIEQDADMVIFPVRQDPNEPSGPAVLAVRKHRGGPMGDAKCWWHGETTSFENAGQEVES